MDPLAVLDSNMQGKLMENHTMKKIALAAALSLAASTAFAGGLAAPIVEPEVVEAQASSSAPGLIVPLLLLVLVGAAVAAS